MKKKLIIFVLIMLAISFINYGLNTKYLKEIPKERKTVSRSILMQDGESAYEDDDEDDEDDDDNDEDNENNNEDQKDNSNENTDDENAKESNPYEEVVDDDSVETKPKSNETEEQESNNSDKDEITENPKTGSITFIVVFILLLSIISIVYARKSLKLNDET